VQQFNLTDGQAGMVIGGVTNINVPGDTDGSANSSIAAKLNFPDHNFMQNTIGQFIFRLSSPSGHFSTTNVFFSITNFPYAQRITGTVVSNTTPVPNAVIILFPAPRGSDHGPGEPVGGTVANNSGVYSIQVPPGTYEPVAFKSNYVANFSTSPLLTVSSGTTTTNLALTSATATISGKLVDADNSSIGLPGVMVPATSNSGSIAVGFTDTNGNFTLRVGSGSWGISGDAAGSLNSLGYVGYDNNTNVNAGTTGLVFPFKKATALFYGTVKDNFGNPLPGIDINAYASGAYSSDGNSDTNGYYVVGVMDIGMSWQVQVSNDSSPTNYLFSQGGYDFVSSGQAMRQDFTAVLATNRITGNVQFNGTNVIGVQVDAYATIGTNSYQSQMDTDANGNYSLNVANGDWSVNVYDCGCGDNDSLSTVLNDQNYEDPASQNVTINNNNGTNNFTVQLCGGVSITTTSPLPDATNGDYYDIQLQGSDCNNNFIWSLDDPSDFPSSLTFNSDGEIFGTPDASGTYNFSVNVNDGNGHSADTNLSLTIVGAASPLQITTFSLPNGTNTEFYSQTLQASGGTLPYSWAVADYSISVVLSNLTLATNGVLSGTLSATTGSYSFDVQVTDGAANTVYQTLPLYVVNPPLPPLIITNTSLPNGNVGAVYNAQLGATGGQSPYYWTLATVSSPLPAGLSLNSNGLISGTPTTNKPSTFKFQVQDQIGTITNKVLSITINSNPVLVSQSWQTNRFQMRLTGAANQNYTLQLSTNLSSTNWTPLFVTNNSATNSFLLTDPDATNKQRFYRILIGP
ncbi:MAG TPA: Ig domain-containing protein, partial [Verrucomicrobiae bacterium]